MVSAERVWALLAPWLGPEDAHLIRAVVYRFHATVAESIRSRRIFLAGDSAHQMPPFLGQGLCSGVRDAANLIWKLALVQQGLAHDSLLDTYGEERLPHASGVVANAVDTGILIDQLSGRIEADKSIEAGYGGARPFPHLEHGLIHGDHPSVGRQVPQPMVDGARLDDLFGNGFVVVVTDEVVAHDVREPWETIGGSVLTVPGDALPGLLVDGGAVIVRPDRQIAAVAADQVELQIATDDLLGRLSGR
jgi:3-(3-hydroxy-phenyl)propionate hydroxylase